MRKGRLTQRRSIISNARVIKAITECGPLLLASVGNSPKLERMDFSPVLSAMIMAFLYNQTTAPFFKIITQNLLLSVLHCILLWIFYCIWVSASTGTTAGRMQKTIQCFSNWLSCTALHFQTMQRSSSFGHFKDYIYFSVELSVLKKISKRNKFV